MPMVQLSLRAMTTLSQHYSKFYQEEPPSRWRELGAVGKAQNVINIWRRAFADIQPRSVVEIGCGTGEVIRQLVAMRFGREFAGYDISPAAIASARETLGIQWGVLEGGRVPAEASTYDVAVLSHVIEHVSDPRAIVAEAMRVARAVIAEVPLEMHWRAPKHFHWTRTGHINYFTPWSFRQLLESALAPEELRVRAELVTCPALAVYQFRSKLKGTIAWLGKRSLLACGTPIATRLATYHMTALVER